MLSSEPVQRTYPFKALAISAPLFGLNQSNQSNDPGYCTTETKVAGEALRQRAFGIRRHLAFRREDPETIGTPPVRTSKTALMYW